MMDTSIAMIPITTNNSTRVKPRALRFIAHTFRQPGPGVSLMNISGGYARLRDGRLHACLGGDPLSGRRSTRTHKGARMRGAGRRTTDGIFPIDLGFFFYSSGSHQNLPFSPPRRFSD